MTTDLGATFRALHTPGTPFILANVWDLGSAQVMAALGAKALATSSAAYGFTRGQPDGGQMSRDDSLAHAEEIVAATGLPVQGDFEDGFGEAPETVAETVRLAAEAGLAGICVEDTALPSDGFYDFDLSIERIRAGAAAARALPRDFVFTARADGLLTGSYDQAEALRRITAFGQAGADCLYAPLPASMADLAALVATSDRPFNALVAGQFTGVSQAEFAKIGVARISLGSSLARATHKTLVEAAEAMLGAGDFSPLANSASSAVIDPLLEKGRA